MITKEIINHIKKTFIPSFNSYNTQDYLKVYALLICYLSLLIIEILATIIFVYTKPTLLTEPNIILCYVICTFSSLSSLYFLHQGKLNTTINITITFLSIMIIAGLLSKMTVKRSMIFPTNIFYALAALNIISIFATKTHIKIITTFFVISVFSYYIYMKDIFPLMFSDSARLISVMGIGLIFVVASVSYSFVHSSESARKIILNEIKYNSKLNQELNNLVKKRAEELFLVNKKFTQVNNEIAIADKNIQDLLHTNNKYGLKSQEIVNSMLSKTQKGALAMNEMNDAFKSIKNANSELNDILNIFNSVESRISLLYDITFETKILSINASIEAARAKNINGQGFAVVAGEVGSLALKSNDAALEIEKILRESKEQVIEIIGNITQQSENIQEISNNSIDKYSQLSKEINLLCDQVNLIKTNNLKQENVIDDHFKKMKIA
ncbi:MAG: hypothetical protein HQK49_07560 [Oligoflexia bacterium]|nr:hypothetical protein [Oligoflexia bacterium]